MLNIREIATLLGRLCVERGHCLAVRQADRFVAYPPSSPREFASGVLEAEGLDPSTHMRQFQDVLAAVERAFLAIGERAS